MRERVHGDLRDRMCELWSRCDDKLNDPSATLYLHGASASLQDNKQPNSTWYLRVDGAEGCNAVSSERALKVADGGNYLGG